MRQGFGKGEEGESSPREVRVRTPPPVCSFISRLRDLTTPASTFPPVGDCFTRDASLAPAQAEEPTCASSWS